MRRQPHECMVACYILFSTSDTMSMNDSQLPLHGMRFDTGRDRRNIRELMWQPMLSMRVVQTNALMAYGCTVQLLPNKRDAIRLVSLKRDPHPQCSEYICEPASGAHPHTVCRTGQLYGPRLAPTHRPALTQALLHTNTLTQAHTCTHPGSPTHTHTHTHTQKHTHAHTHTHTHTHTYTQTHTHTHTHTQAGYAHTHTHTHTHTQAG